MRDRDTPSRQRSVVLLGLGALAAAIVAVAVAAVGGVGEGEALGELPQGSLDVDLPTQPEGRPPPDAAGRGPDPGDRPPAPLCTPEPCERWRVELPPGSTAVDDVVYHVGRTDWRLQVTALDPHDGSTRWSEALAVPDATNGDPLPDRRPAIFTGLDDLVLVAAPGWVQARARADGRLVWTYERAGWAPLWAEPGPEGSVLLSITPVDRHGDGEAAPDRDALVALDAATGAVRWQREVFHAFAPGRVADGPVFVLDPGAPRSGEPVHLRELVALDPATGHEQWRIEAGGGFRVTDSVVVVRSEDRFELLDPMTGTPRGALGPGELDVDAYAVEIHGQLLVQRGLEEGASSHRSEQVVVVRDARDGREVLAVTGTAWIPVVPLPDGGIAALWAQEGVLTATALDGEGRTRWERRFGLPHDELLHPVDLDEAGSLRLITLATIGGDEVVARRIDARSGDDLAVFPLDVDRAALHGAWVELPWPVVVAYPTSDSIRLHGRAGTLQLGRSVELRSTDPLIVSTPRGEVVRLDERRLLGDG